MFFDCLCVCMCFLKVCECDILTLGGNYNCGSLRDKKELIRF